MFISPWSLLRRHLSCSRTHSTETYEVVGQAGQAHQLLVALDASQFGLAQGADRLAPTKELLDAFAHDLTGPIAAGLYGAGAQTRREVSGVEGYVRRDALCKQSLNEPTRVLALVAADALWSKALAPLSCQQPQGRFRLRHNPPTG